MFYTPVCHLVHRGVSASLHAGVHTPSPLADTPQTDIPLGRHHPGQTLPRQTPPLADTLLGRHPLGRTPLSDTMGYSQQAGCTHPTGMHTCHCV